MPIIYADARAAEDHSFDIPVATPIDAPLDGSGLPAVPTHTLLQADSQQMSKRSTMSIQYSQQLPGPIQETVQEGAKLLTELDMGYVEARVCVVLDISASMEYPNKFISSKKLQNLLNQFFSLAILLDDNKEIEVFLLGAAGSNYPMYIVNKDNYLDFITTIIKSDDDYARGTSYDTPIKQVLSHYFPEESKTTWKDEAPVFCTFITDGAPNPPISGLKAQQLIAGAANEGKPIFFKLLALHGDNLDFKLLQGIDDDKNRAFDNCDFVPVSNNQPLTMKDLIKEFRGFVLEVNQRGFLAIDYNISKKHLRSEDRVIQRSENGLDSALVLKILSEQPPMLVVSGLLAAATATYFLGAAVAVTATATCVVGGGYYGYQQGFFNQTKNQAVIQEPTPHALSNS